ncbi:transcription factor 7-like 2 isoform X1 [Montipora capricornis]|uniref:transcription factor 7-like 2 isoform X1 n=1 Tax=Montipora foliosa TaxID=591990 RepID=UPI0035F1FB32
MPQLPNNSTEDLGADDEVKEYNQEDGEDTENGAHLDLVNDIKSDLIKKETENSEDSKPSSASSAPIAQLLSFPDRYNEHLNSGSHSGYPSRGPAHVQQDDIKHSLHRGHGPRPAGIFHPAHHHPYAPAPQYQYMYPGVKPDRRFHFEPPIWQPHSSIIGQPSSQYPPSYPSQVGPTSAGIQRLSHPTLTADPRGPVCCPPPPPNQTVISRAPATCGAASLLTSQSIPAMVDHPGMDLAVSGHMKGHIKKPLNAFMLYMKDMRSKVVSECTLKESAAINQILGKRWHALDRQEQAKYYEMARKERALHMQLYPGWSARDNYAQQGKKKKRKRDKSQAEITNPKKCRARYGLDRQHEWCKPCRRKKKCVRFLAGGSEQDISPSDNTGNLESENIDANIDGSPSMITTTGSTTPTS